MSEEQPKPGTSILIVGLTPDVLAHVRAVVAPHGMDARATTLVKLRADTLLYKPFVVLVDAYLYDFDPPSFDKLAHEVGAKVGIVGSAKEAKALLLQMLSPPAPSVASTPAEPDKPLTSTGRREFETAKYDVKTLNDALERMSRPRPEFTTAKYDAKTLEEALERMSAQRSDSEADEADDAASSDEIEHPDDS